MNTKCIKKNSLGECIEWVRIGDDLMPYFRKEVRECNADLWKEWKTATKERRILVKPEDD